MIIQEENSIERELEEIRNIDWLIGISDPNGVKEIDT